MTATEPIEPRRALNGTKHWVPILALIVNSILVPMWVWVATEIIDLRRWQAATEANRFTSSDGAAVYRQLAAIQSQLAAMPAGTQAFRDIEARLDKQADTLNAIRERLAAIEEKVAK